ncbi:MAG: hypothetical protein ACK4NA_04420 [Alphaproteobacteria bacterium]
MTAASLCRSLLPLALAAALLAACGTPQPRDAAYMSWYEKYPDWKPGDPWPDDAGAPSAAPALPNAAPPASPKAATATPRAPAEASPQRQAALPPSPPPRELPPEPPKLEELRGLNAGELTQLLGKPTLLRAEATAQMWQYRGESCVLHLFLYPAGGAAGEARVSYVEARPRQTGAPAVTAGPSECLATLVGTRRLKS